MKSPSEKSKRGENPESGGRKSLGERQSSGSCASDPIPPCSNPCKWSPPGPCTLQAVSQGPLFFADVRREILPLQGKLGLKRLQKAASVPSGFRFQQESFLRSVQTVLLRGRARGEKPSQGDVNGTQGTPPPTAETAYGSTCRFYRFWAAAAHSQGPIPGGRPPVPCTSNSTKAQLPHRHQADQGLMGQPGYANDT